MSTERTEYARRILKSEADAVLALLDRITDSFSKAVDSILACKGRVVVSGMGKAGIIGQKISATLASTGTPALFLHPAEALHGDLGKVTGVDVVLAISNSGETEELVRLLPSLREIGAKVVSITTSASSSLGKYSDVVLETGNITEACPLGLAPSASTTAALALGDALALVVLQERGFDKESFAFYHPAGELGRQLLQVRDVMRTGSANPIVAEDAPLLVALDAITRARAGAISVVDKHGKLAGIFTDGDLRRHIGCGVDPKTVRTGELMTRSPIAIAPERLATEALRMLRQKKIDELPVVDSEHRPIGMLDVQDLLEVGTT
ncbi:MAG: KpsF/GutQ family sugar-phosphate isomerase [Planctomycetota bacterium]|nr:KpsF/GutQ family sugar-phosphate isomerase [Planctomycetota bacterium]